MDRQRRLANVSDVLLLKKLHFVKRRVATCLEIGPDPSDSFYMAHAEDHGSF